MSGHSLGAPDRSKPPEPRARRVRLSRNRALVGDVVHFAQRIPRFAVDRLMPLAELSELRERAETEVSDGVAYALDAPYPDVSEVTEHVFA